jgi:2-succinyl-5-enolpyruvyl-6-hydroxy-3-cyclohexene-1-carboxylate synthase
MAGGGWPDPNSRARQLLTAEPELSVEALTTALNEARRPDSTPGQEQRAAYRRWLLAADREVWHTVDALLDRDVSRLSEGQAVRTTLDTLPVGSLLLLGNSLPVREVDLYCPGRRGGVVVVSQRGANGIDGLVSGAAGAADLAHCPTTLLLGDVSLLHDLGGLWIARRAKTPLVVVVLNNAGGRIFDTLDVGCPPSIAREDLEAWITPPDLSIAKLAELFAARYARATTRRDLACALQAGYRHPGLSLVEADIDPTGVARQLSELAQEAQAAIESLGAPPWLGSA